MDMTEEMLDLKKQIAILSVRVNKINELYKQLKILISLNDINFEKNRPKREISYNSHLDIEKRLRSVKSEEY